MDCLELEQYREILAKIEHRIQIIEDQIANLGDFDQISRSILQKQLKKNIRRKVELKRFIDTGTPILCSECWDAIITIDRLIENPFAEECENCHSKKLICV